jgi:hypothetical protein
MKIATAATAAAAPAMAAKRYDPCRAGRSRRRWWSRAQAGPQKKR